MAKYRCPECGSTDLGCDLEVWIMANPNDDVATWRELIDRDNVELADGGNPYTVCRACDHDGDLWDFEV